MELSEEVIKSLSRQQKIEAIKLLREETGMGLAEAKKEVEEYVQAHPELLHSQQSVVERNDSVLSSENIISTIKTVAVIGTFVWMMINSVSVAGSLIILFNENGYRKGTFTVENIYYHNDHESGLSWGFDGKLEGKKIRMLAPDMADGKSLNKRGLQQLYPNDTKLMVLYNPDVTLTLFQKRSLNIIPYVSDIVEKEIDIISWWGKFCILPFVIMLFLSSRKIPGKERA
jgi:ribosomal L7/L12-like protein